MKKIDPPVCIALDKPDLDSAIALVDALHERVPVFKVGLQLFTAVGPAAVEAVLSRGRDVFLDLKLSDIPNTVAGATRSASALGARFLTVHGNAGRASVRAAVEAAGDTGPRILVLSVLTSLSDTDVADIGVPRSASDQVDLMAALAVAERAPGLVLGATEVARVRAAHPDLFLLVPGIRTADSAIGDQRRVGTARDVVADGADLIVLGRAVTAADDPSRALDGILDEIGNGVPA